VDLCVAAKVIDFRKVELSLVDICMEETGGLGVDCIVDHGGMNYFMHLHYN
jgi:NADPH:quinone reductase-like Zn-dependent oxidoreductase